MWDCYLQQKINKLKARLARRRDNQQAIVEENTVQERRQPQDQLSTDGIIHRRSSAVPREIASSAQRPREQIPGESASRSLQHGLDVSPPMDVISHAIPLRWGLCIIGCFFSISPSCLDSIYSWAHRLIVSFAAIIAIRTALGSRPLALDLFSNMYLAGTIIFGGGPVVIPLMRSYVVDPGWVSSRDFLIGLAIIQAFPGPNFNFGVYLGALAVLHVQPTGLGALLGFFGIFLPGLALAVGTQSLWRVLRTKPAVISVLRGVNATAVGLVFTAVYRLWEIGYLTLEDSNGKSLASEPWWVVVAALTYAESAWFRVPAPVAIVFGGVFGLCWYGAVMR